jgi:alkylated DNA repair dioxygenase AlkB
MKRATQSLSPATDSLFASTATAVHAPAAETLQIPDAEITYIRDFYAAAESAALLQTLLDETPWRQESLRFGGKEVLVPRLQAWYGDRRYGYSGLKLTPLPWTPVLDDMRRKIAATARLEFNSVLVNYYRDGNDSVAWHADDERELGPDPLIASLSFGATRRFELKHRTRKQSRLSISLENGSLLLMGSGLQQHWVHQLPKDPGITLPRINLTFRFIH